MRFLRCPEGGELQLESFKQEYRPSKGENEIVEGILRSKRTGRIYPIWNGIPRLLPTSLIDDARFRHEHYAELGGYPTTQDNPDATELDRDTQRVKSRFEYQWAKWGSKKLYGMTAEEWRAHFFGNLVPPSVGPSFFRDKTVLEVGCGPGMLARVLSPLCKEYVGLDLGRGVDVARRWTRHLPNVSFVQGDIMAPPIKKDTFDVGLGLGVLHSTPKTSEAFSNIAPLVRIGGNLVIWVYPKRHLTWEISNRFLRSFTTRLPSSLTYYMSYLLTPLLAFFPPSTQNRIGKSSPKELAQSVFDWLAPPYQGHHTPAEVLSWYKQAGYGDVILSKIPVGAIGTRVT